MSNILKVQDLYDSYNDSHFGYLGIDLDSKEVNLYSDDARKQKGDIVYKLDQNDEDFYWEFYHNGEYKRFDISKLSEEAQSLILELINKQVAYSKKHNREVNITSDVINNVGLNFNGFKVLKEIPYYNLYNDLYISNLSPLLKKDDEEIPSKELREKYNKLMAEVEVHHMLPLYGKGKYYEEREKRYKETLKQLSSDEMLSVRKYLETKNNNKKEMNNCLSSLLFGLGEIKVSSITIDEQMKKVKVKVGFYEESFNIEDTKLTEDGDNFIFISPTYIKQTNQGEILELIFNDLECREIDKEYNSVIKQTYGPLLDFITDGKLREARYNGGISDFHKVLFEIIPDVNVSEELLDLIQNGHSDEEVYKLLTIYAESIIENKKLEGEELYNFIKKCKIFGSNDIKYEGNNFTEYIESNPQLAKVSNIYRKLISINKGKKIYNLVEIINKYAKENPGSLELQILDIFAQKYLVHYRIEVIGSKLSIGNMMLEMQAHRIEDEAIEYTEDGRTLKEPHGITRKKLEELEDKFYVFLPKKLKYALINEENMELEMNKIFGNLEEKGIKETFKRIRNNIKGKI